MKRIIVGVFKVCAAAVSLSACAVQGNDNALSAIAPRIDQAEAKLRVTAAMQPAGDQSTTQISTGHFLADTGITAPTPAGYTSFCVRFADQCEADAASPRTITLTDEIWKKLSAVNLEINEAIWPQEDSRHYGRNEYWTIPTDGYGDCEDIALTKRKKLTEAGLPLPALRMAVVITPKRDRHAVLTIATDKGDFVLDNLNDTVQSWDKTGYRWIERQNAAEGWVSLQDAPRLLAGNDMSLATGSARAN